MRYVAALLLLLSIAICSRANDTVDGHSINLQKQGSHYVFSADINGVAEAKVLLESGIPAMLADSAFIFSSGVLSDLELSPTSGEKINLGGRTYVITHKTCGVVKISEKITYSGEVFILSQYAKDYDSKKIQAAISELFSPERIANELQKIYEKLISREKS